MSSSISSWSPPVVQRTITAAPDQTGFDESSLTTSFTGNFSNALLSGSIRLTGVDSLGQPTTGYRYVPQTVPHYTWLRNSSGWNNATASNAGRTGAAAYRTKIYHDGQGDCIAYNATAFCNSTRAGSTSFLANPAIALFGGDLQAGADGVYLNAAEMILQDMGFDVAGVGWVINLERTVGTGAKDAWWGGYRVQSIGAAQVDAFFSGSGKARIGLDLTTGNFTTTTNAAVAIKADQRIYLNATNVHANLSPDETVVGAEYLSYRSATGDVFLTAPVGLATTTPTAITELDASATKTASHVLATITDPTSAVAAFRAGLNQISVNLPSNPAGGVSYVGGAYIASIPTGNAISQGNVSLFGINAKGTHQGTGDINILAGLACQAFNTSTGTVSILRGAQFAIRNSGVATVSNAYGIFIPDLVNAGTITATYGIYVGDMTTGTQTNQAFNIFLSDAGGINYLAGQLQLPTTSTPASAAATGQLGMVKWDSGFIYVCTATNTWKRVAIATW